MPTPNWGPQAGVPMDQATFDAYVSANPPGQQVNNVFWGGGVPSGNTPNPSQPQPDYWSQFFLNGPASVQMPQFQTANQDQARTEQQRVIQALQAQAAGDPNSLAQQQLANAYQGAQSQQSSLGSTMRGQSAGAAMRGIQAGQQNIQRNLPGDQQMLMLQEQQAAQSMLAQLLAQQQGQDITQAQGMANTQLQGQQLEDAIRQFYASQGLGHDIEQAQIASERNAGKLGFDLAGKDITNRFLNQATQAGAAAIGTIGSFGQPQKSSQQIIDDAFNG